MLEVRIVTEENIYENCINIKNTNKLNFILDEEQKWANEANFERQAKKYVFFGLIAINILILLFFIKKIIKYRKIGKELKAKYNKGEIIKYFREIRQIPPLQPAVRPLQAGAPRASLILRPPPLLFAWGTPFAGCSGRFYSFSLSLTLA